MDKRDELEKLIEEGEQLKFRVRYVLTIKEEDEFATFYEDEPFVRSYGKTPEESKEKFFFLAQGVHLKEEIDKALDSNDKRLIEAVTVTLNMLRLDRCREEHENTKSKKDN